MPRALLKFLLDAIYVVLFFFVMTGAAYGVGLVVRFCEHTGLDPFVFGILRILEIGLVVVDAVGVIIVATILMLRFVRSVLSAEE